LSIGISFIVINEDIEGFLLVEKIGGTFDRNMASAIHGFV